MIPYLIESFAGIDTRALTKKIREEGMMLGKIVLDGVDTNSVAFEDPNVRNLVDEVSCKVSKTIDFKLQESNYNCWSQENGNIRYLVFWSETQNRG